MLIFLHSFSVFIGKILYLVTFTFTDFFICLDQGLLLRVALKGTKIGFDTFHFGGAVVKNPPANAGDPEDTGSILGSGRSPELGNGNSLQYSCLENPMDRRAWQAAIHGVAKNQM